jgi:NitT/TauT family transport system permease protein
VDLVLVLGLGAWLGAWALNVYLARRREPWVSFAVPALFGAALIAVWEAVTRGLAIPAVILPPPSAIGAALAGNLATLGADFVQTVIRAVLPGYAIGCGAAFLVAVAIDRSPFLQRGLLPFGTLMAALPIVGLAPIMVMWFGFDWQSKAAVVVAMTFFPMLVNAVAGFQAADRIQKDLMRTYAASYRQTLLKLRLPAAAPFLFNGLKICSTLALIGAIVAEFFGTPIVGMGFRISTEVGRLALDMVWAEIAVAALAGSVFYGSLSIVERWATFWHPSQRGRPG